MVQGASSRECGQEPARVGLTTQAGLSRAAQSSLALSLAPDPSPKATWALQLAPFSGATGQD